VSTSLRSTKSNSSAPRRRLLTAVVAVAAVVTGPLVVAGTPAQAVPIDSGWSVTASPGAATVTAQNDGSTSAASFSYNMNPAGQNTTRSWDFTATASQTATTGSPIKVPWSWQGLHAWFNVRASLDMIVDGVVVKNLVAAGPNNCCATPSNGFFYGNVAVFDNVPAGHTYGFRLSGSNGDSNNFLRGTFTLSNKPFIDATLGRDNRQWLGAQTITPGGTDGTLDESNEARWYRFLVFPGQKVTVTMPDPPKDYDLALYGDIDSFFERLNSGEDIAQLAAATAGAPSAETEVPDYPNAVSQVPTTAAEAAGPQFAPRVYAPRVYAPRVYAPRVYAPRVYAPRVYAPDSYAPDLTSNEGFRNAFSSAQTLALRTVSVNTGTQTEIVSAATGGTNGKYFYVRVQGHDDKAFDKSSPFHLDLAITGGANCANLPVIDDPTPSLPPTDATPTTLILTDTNKLGVVDDPDPAVVDDPYDVYMKSLDDLAAATNGLVIDVSKDAQVGALQLMAAANPECPYAVNLVGDMINALVDPYRDTLQNIVIAGGDEVIPFFRYPDTAGIGAESQFASTMISDTQAGASLAQDQFLSQDAYGASKEVTISGITLPVPELAVGRLVKTYDEIESTIAHYLDLTPEADGSRNLPIQGDGASLVTGYDFLADAATAVKKEFQTALPNGNNDELISPLGTAPADSWTAERLRRKLFDSHHDLVYLAGHFSANDTLAADFDQVNTFKASELGGDGNTTKLTDTLVLSAGCHSAYSIIDGQQSANIDPADWTQQMARQHAVLIGGTGYQYGDSDLLQYSERLYLGIAQRLREGPETGGAPAVEIGKALALAKQDYLASVTTLEGIDQKAVLQATLYGLPMTGFAAKGHQPIDGATSVADPDPVTTPVTDPPTPPSPGAILGLYTDDLEVDDIPTVRETKVVDEAKPINGTGELTWLTGAEGEVVTQPGAPTLPKHVVDVTVDDNPDLVLRGVGFRSGKYTEQGGVIPLTGSPAVEGSTPNSTFFSPAFWPQKLATPNYFGALGDSGRTSLILTPAQYRNDPGVTDPDSLNVTNTERAYEDLGFRLYYSGVQPVEAGQNQPSVATAPSITDVVGGMGTDGQVHFSVRATGDPSAGVQEVWVTWTSGPGGDHVGYWASVNLAQDDLDSTHWTGAMPMPAGVDRQDIRFLVQAANGVGAVGLDTAEGDGYSVGGVGTIDTSVVKLAQVTPDSDAPLGVTALVTDNAGQPIADRRVVFTVRQGTTDLFGFEGSTDENGLLALGRPDGQALPIGAFTVVAYIFDAQSNISDTDSLDVDPARLSLSAVGTASPFGAVAEVVDLGDQPMVGRTIKWTVLRHGVALYDSQETATGPDGTTAAPAPTDGKVPAGPLTVRAQLLDAAGEVMQTEDLDVVIDGLVIEPNPAYLETQPDTAFPSLSIHVSDPRGAVAGAAVEVTLPEVVIGQPGATSAGFAGSPPTVTLTTDESGNADVPTMTAGPTQGSFLLTMTSPGSVGASVPMAVQYGIGTFVSPVSSTTTTNSSGTTPVKVAVLDASGQPLSDTDAAALLSAGQIQIRWMKTTAPASAWSEVPSSLISYVASRDFYQADLKASRLGWTKPNSYVVEFRVLASGSTPTPDVQSDFDLGSRYFTITVTK
jgi:hypothetical protein